MLDSKNKFITIKDIFTLSEFNGSQIVAGTSGLDNQIKSVTVAEVPDASEWLIGGELVITTGYYIRNNTEFQIQWLNSIIEKGASALAIKPDRFLGEITRELKDIANRNNFPLIELPREIIWPSIIQSVHNKIYEQKNKIIMQAEKIHSKLTKLVLDGGSLEDITSTISNLIGTPILVEDSSLNILSSSFPSEKDYSGTSDIINYRMSGEFQKKLKKSYQFKQSVTNRNGDPFKFPIKPDEDISQNTLPIVANQILYGFLSAIELEKKLDDLDVIALEHGATTIALEMMKEKIRIDEQKRSMTTLIDELITGNIHNEIKYYQTHEFYNFDILSPTFVQIMYVNNNNKHWVDETNEKKFYELKDHRIADLTESIYKKNNLDVLVILQGSKLIVLTSFPKDIDKVNYLYTLKDLNSIVLEKVNQLYPENELIIGIGDPYYDISSFSKSYNQAKISIEMCKKFIGYNNVVTYHELGILRLLTLIENKQELINFCNDMIGDLITYEKKHQKDQYLHILETYLKNNGNISKTSRELYIHVNTLNYNMKKISKILNTDLNDAQVRFNIYLALSVKRLLIDS